MTNTQENLKNLLPIRLGMDLDGVIYNFVEEFREYVITHKGFVAETLPEVTTWEFYLDWGMTFEEYEQVLTEAAIAGYVFKNGNAYAGAVEALNKVSMMNFEIVVITARRLTDVLDHHDIIETNTANWLLDNKIAHDKLIIDNDKTTHGLAVLVDDSVGNVEKFIMAGGRAYIFDRPWNQGSPYSRIMDWDHFVTEMQDLRNIVDSAFLNDLQTNTI